MGIYAFLLLKQRGKRQNILYKATTTKKQEIQVPKQDKGIQAGIMTEPILKEQLPDTPKQTNLSPGKKWSRGRSGGGTEGQVREVEADLENEAEQKARAKQDGWESRAEHVNADRQIRNDLFGHVGAER